MDAWGNAGLVGLFGSCFVLSIVSALVPWVNGEILLLSLAALAPSSSDLVVLVILASCGQMVGKCVLYWSARGARQARASRLGGKIDRWTARFNGTKSKQLALVLVSSTVGIPPFYIISFLAGACQLNFMQFLGFGMCGRLIRFSLLVSVPQLAVQLVRG
jgi:membrane protein YqaA with SNARE-associated domain